MCRRRLTLVILLSLLLCACSKENVDDEIALEQEAPIGISEQFQIIDFEDLEFKSLGNKCGYLKNDDNICIYPYYNEDKYVEVSKVLISTNKLADGIANSVSGDAVYKTKRYVYVTMPSGETYGFLPFNDDYMYLFRTDSLPSVYVRAVMNRCRRLNT